MTTDNLGPFIIGQQPVVTATFADLAGGIGVASAATFMIRTPAGAESSTSSPNAAITNPSPNVWKYTMPILAADGIYAVRVKTTSGLDAAGETLLTVLPSAFTTP